MNFNEILDVVKTAKDIQEDGVVTLEEATQFIREVAEVFGVQEYLQFNLPE